MILVPNERAFHPRISLSDREENGRKKIKVEPDNWIRERSGNFHNEWRNTTLESGMDPERSGPLSRGLIYPF